MPTPSYPNSPPLLTQAAPAKINLFLNVRGLRPDGYHEVVTVMQPLALCDTLSLWQGKHPGLKLTTDCPALEYALEKGKGQNLIEKAHLRFYEALGQTPAPIHIHLNKVIPFEAGLGGGSSDAAATLNLLNSYHQRALSHTQLCQVAATLGSDVPFFLTGGTALATGRGEHIQPLPQVANHPHPMILIKPNDFGVSTPVAYQHLRAAGQYQNVDPTPLIEALQQPIAVPQLAPLLLNDFEVGLAPHYPELAAIFMALNSFGVPRPLLCGSGAAVAALLDTPLVPEDWERLLALFPPSRYNCLQTQTVPKAQTAPALPHPSTI